MEANRLNKIHFGPYPFFFQNIGKPKEITINYLYWIVCSTKHCIYIFNMQTKIRSIKASMGKTKKHKSGTRKRIKNKKKQILLLVKECINSWKRAFKVHLLVFFLGRVINSTHTWLTINVISWWMNRHMMQGKIKLLPGSWSNILFINESMI